jgi:hypothetical protein
VTVLRSPALHFLVLGAMLFAASRMTSGSPASPTGSDDELLYRAALDLGVDRNDRAVRERLARLGSFVGEDAADESALVAEAQRLGLERTDLVVKRHLALVMRLAAGRAAPSDLPTDDDVRAWVAAHPDEVATPGRTRFTQVYLSSARRGDELDATARALLATLQRDEVPPARAPLAGDAFIGGADIGPLSDADLDRRLGPGFAAALGAVAPGTWGGPIRSSYGLHLVWIHERLPQTAPALQSVRGRIVHRLLRERQERQTRDRIAALRTR